MRRRFLMMFAASALVSVAACSTTPSSGAKKIDEPLLMKPFLLIIKRHRELGTHLDGPRCPMLPTCANYAYRALTEHSFLGLLLFIDRLFFRENGDFRSKYMILSKKRFRELRYYDPLEDALPLLKEKRPSLYREDFLE